MLVEPSSWIKLYADIPISNGQNIPFKSRDEQRAYFASKQIDTLSNNDARLTYQRASRGTIKIFDEKMTIAYKANYMSFCNEAFENKEFYARITGYEYINNNTVQISYVIDPWQTWMFDITFHEDSYVEREQLSQGLYTRALQATALNCKNDYQMLSPEPLAVNTDLETFYDIGGDRSNMKIMPTATTDSSTKARPYDRCILFKLSLPATFASEDTYSYSKTDDDANQKALILKLACYMDGFRSMGPDSKMLWGVPNTFMLGYIDIDNDIDTSFYTGTAPYELKGGQARVQRILDILAVVDSTSAITSMQAVPMYAVYSVLNKHVVNFANDTTLTIGDNNIPMTVNYSQTFAYKDAGNLHPKCQMYPYNYLRVISPDGSRKEYKYEDFIGDVTLDIDVNFNGTGSISVYPVGYKCSNPAQLWTDHIQRNWEERIDYNNLPEIPYMTDAYLSALGANYTRDIQNNQWSGLGMFNDAVTGLTEVALGGATAAQGMTSGNVLNVTTGASRAVGGAAQSIGSLMELSNMQDAYSRSADSPKYNSTRQAYINDNYHAGSGNLKTLQFNQGTFFYIQQVTLKDSILKMYSDYFNLYGVTTRRMGAPLIMNYVNGSTDPNELPQFIDGQTYVKTNGCAVIAPIKPVADAIEAMFDSGVRFVEV